MQRIQTDNATPTSCARAESLNRIWPFVPMLREFVARRVSANDVEDIVQESLVRVWRRDGDAPIEHPKSYLVRIAKAVIIDRSRREGTRRMKMHCGLEERHHPNDPLSPHRIVLGREQLMIFMRGFEQLPSRTRDILLAIRMDGQSFKAVAKRFGISVSAVEKVVTGALRVLSEHLKEAERAQRMAASLRPRTPRPSARPQRAVEHRPNQ
jgi:RNA polymerase sigma-70 factor (ECF subfamily)